MGFSLCHAALVAGLVFEVDIILVHLVRIFVLPKANHTKGQCIVFFTSLFGIVWELAYDYQK